MDAVQLADYCFSAHLHVKFSALVTHNDSGKITKFLSLAYHNKHEILQIVEFGKKLSSSSLIQNGWPSCNQQIICSVEGKRDPSRIPNADRH